MYYKNIYYIKYANEITIEKFSLKFHCSKKDEIKCKNLYLINFFASLD